jgi:hypothetical protein
MAGLLGEFDTMESELKSERVSSKIEQSAWAGHRMAGGHKPYGYALTYKIVSASGEETRRRIIGVAADETEAAVMTECAGRCWPVSRLRRSGGISTRDASLRAPALNGRSRTCAGAVQRPDLGLRQYIPTNSHNGPRSIPGPTAADSAHQSRPAD